MEFIAGRGPKPTGHSHSKAWTDFQDLSIRREPEGKAESEGKHQARREEKII